LEFPSVKLSVQIHSPLAGEFGGQPLPATVVETEPPLITAQGTMISLVVNL
jgi:hypothetical protein